MNRKGLSKAITKLFDGIRKEKKPYTCGRMSIQDPPKSHGRYRIIGPKGNIKYIGISNDLERRKREHERAGKLAPKKDKYVWTKANSGVPYHKLREQEKKEIKKHQPPQNKNIGGRGRSPKKRKGIRSLISFSLKG